MKETNGHYEADNWMTGKYLLGDKLGQGGFGVVRRAVHLTTGESVAIKVMNKAKLGADLKHIYQEIATLKDLMHQNICRLYQVAETKRDIYLVLEYCEQGEMFDYIIKKTKLPEPEARYFFRQLVAAMAYVHKQGYAHRDLKPENLLLKGASQQLKVIDFGLSSRTGKPLDTYCGSLCYAAPEIIMNRPYNGPAADIWSMGVLLYILVTGTAPFNSNDQAKLTQSITRGIYKIPSGLTPDCQMLIKGMLTVDVSNRMRMDQIMTHRWVGESYSVLKASSIYRKDTIDEEIVKEMSFNLHIHPKTLLEELKQWKYDYNTATYLALLQRKENAKSCAMPVYNKDKGNVVNIPAFHQSLEKNLDEYPVANTKEEAKKIFERNDVEFVRSPPPISRKTDRTDKENVIPEFAKPLNLNLHSYNNPQPAAAPNPFCTPKRNCDTAVGKPFNKRHDSLPRQVDASAPTTIPVEKPKPVAQTPIMRSRAKGPPPQQSPVVVVPRREPANEQQQTPGGTPTTPTTTRQPRSEERTARRPGLVKSLDRGKNRMLELLTPRRLRRDNTKVKVCKNYANVSITGSTSEEVIRDRLIKVLQDLNLTASTEGWKVFGVDAEKKISVELEVVKVEQMPNIGVKRKRICGDAFRYKEFCEAVLKLAGI